MDERLFLSRMFEKYNLSDFSIETQTPKYKAGLRANIDYYKLWQYVDNNCRSMPTVIELNKIVENRHFLHSLTPALQHIQDIKRTPKFDISKESEGYKLRIRQKLLKIGIIPGF